ncbi:MAG: DNA-directed RNA polymerase subunit omega [Proteobacteria bacterium]|nr:DNA-directed RNA polymerase subunit omega [Pseudomonadota bacterium]
MKLETMEKSLNLYPNRFHLTMMAVARAREINEGDRPLVDSSQTTKPVVIALEEIARKAVVPASIEEMNQIRAARKILREKALMEARERDALLQIEEGPEDDAALADLPRVY